MDLEEAKIKSQITQEEIDAVQKYINSGHTAINSLIGFKVSDYIDSAKKGWVLPGINSNNPKEKSGEEVLEIFEEAANIYSAMVKTMYEDSLPNKLMRGTSNDEAKSLKSGGKYNKIISTSTNEMTAKSFGQYGNAAFLRIIPEGDIPYINVNEFVGKENLNRYENEYILAPFTQVKSSIFRSNWDGYKYYDVLLEKPEMRSFENGDKEKLQTEIKENFYKNIEKGKELRQLQNEYEWFSSRKGENAEDRKFLSDKKIELLNTIQQMTPEIREFEEKMSQYVQGLFVEREKEYKKAYDINLTEKIRQMNEAEKLRREQSIKEQKQSFTQIKRTFEGVMDKVPTTLYQQYYALKDEEIKYYNMAQTLGISFNMYVQNDKIENSIHGITQNIQNMKEKIEEVQEKSFLENEKDAMKATSIIDNFAIKASHMKVTQNLLMDTVKFYSDSALFDTKKGLDEKVQTVIKETKLKLLEIKKQELGNRKISWFGRIRGLGKLRDIEVANIELEEQILRNSGIKQKSEYSVQDTLADMRAFSIKELNGENTEEMQNLMQSVQDVFDVNNDVIEERARRKLNSVPMVMVDPRRKVRTSEKIAKAEKRNEDLRAEFIDTYNSYGMNFSRYTNVDSLQKFYNLLEEAEKDTKIEYSESTHGIDKKPSLGEYPGNGDFGVK